MGHGSNRSGDYGIGGSCRTMWCSPSRCAGLRKKKKKKVVRKGGNEMNVYAKALMTAGLAIWSSPALAERDLPAEPDLARGMQIGLGPCVSQTAPGRGIAA